MTQKRLKRFAIGGAVLAALALGGSASAGAATPSVAARANAAETVTGYVPSKASAAPLTRVRGGSAGALHHVRDGWIRELHLAATSATSDATRV